MRTVNRDLSKVEFYRLTGITKPVGIVRSGDLVVTWNSEGKPHERDRFSDLIQSLRGRATRLSDAFKWAAGPG